ncbi:MAG: GAF domain-containing protein [Anaerolineae bacterium]|nr:GAF domain-containing protein [Anaerolineae bacterium]
MIRILSSFFNKIFYRTGGWYLIICVAISQLIGIPGTILGVASIQMNSSFGAQQLSSITTLLPVLILVTSFILFIYAIGTSKIARKRLTQIKKIGKSDDDFEFQKNAWKQITGFTWRYGLTSGFFSLIIIVSGITSYHYYVLNSSLDQVIFSLTGGIVSVITTVLLATYLLERMLIPARLALFPTKFEYQLSDRTVPLLGIKVQALVSLLLLASILIIGPIGYNQAVIALNQEVSAQKVLQDLQFQFILMSGVILLLGLLLSLIVSRSISDQVKNINETFKKFDLGDLSQRANITSSDEISDLAIYFNRLASRLESLQTSLDKEIVDRTAQLKSIMKVGLVATSTLDTKELINQVVNIIVEEFEYYYAAIYLTDPNGRHIELKGASGEAGRVLVESNHRFDINDQGLIALSIRSRKAQIALDIGEKAIKFNNPLLPYTRSEVSLPLIIGDRIIGALDLQSTKEADFNEKDLDTLQGLANQLAIAIGNSSLYQEISQGLQEMRKDQKQYLHEAWLEKNIPPGDLSISVGNEPDKSKGTKIEVPVALRGQVIGKLSLSGEKRLSPEDETWMQAIGTQTAIALENARLIKESQTTVIRENIINEITNKIWGSTTIDGILQTVVKELGLVLDASEATIEIEVNGEKSKS